MNSFNKVMEYIVSCSRLNLLRVGLLLPAFFISSASFAATDAVCAVVKIEIQQELTLERQAFDAVMRINNGLDLLSLENVNINVTFKDETGAAVEATSDTTSTTAKFFIKVDSMTGINDISGFGTVAPKTTAEVHWLIIPAPGAGGLVPSGKLYFIGATLSYNLGGELQTTTVTPDSIYVKPLPLLTLDYFLEKDVLADDAFTPDVVEPAIPFTLGVRVKNNGAASATGLKIDSAQPTIIENKQGLLIGFNIIGSNVNEQPETNSLLIDFGEIKPNEASMGRWDMVTTLSGRFTEFTADFSHADDLGGRLTSIIDPAGINTHTLVRNVLVDVAGRDFVRDFLAVEGTAYRVYESSGVDTDVTDVSGSSNLTEVSGGTEASLNLTMPVATGFSYAKFDDPYSGTKVVKQLVRSDGKNIPLDNVWTSQTRNLNTDPISWNYYINFFDANTTGTYALLMGPADVVPTAPEFTPMGNVTTYETATVSFPVSATDVNGDAVILSSGALPAGATFTSDTSGSGTFTWTPSVGQAGNHTITFTASDGTLSNQASVIIKVNPAWDTDGDGMDDAWEILMFGDLSRDGTGDLDGDGISDLQEFLDQTDPNLDPPLAPINLVALPGNAENTLNWDTVTGVDSYNVYWSLTADVSPTTGTLINASTSPFIHTGLDNDVTYYYIVTSVGAGGESAGSNVVSVTTGVRDWTAPVNLQTNSGSTFNPQNVQIAMSATGDAIAVWQQTDNGLNSIWSSRYIPLTGWTTPALISDVTVDSMAVQIAMDADGNAIVVWQQVNPAQTDIVAAHFDVVNSVWEIAAAIETNDTAVALNPQIVISQTGTNAGNALVVWQQGSQDGNTTIMSNTFIAQAWQTATVVSTETVTDLSQLTLSMNENGDAFAAWVSTSDQTNYDLRVNKFSNNVWATTVVTLATGLDNWLQPALDINATGSAVMAWPAFNGTRHVMMASQYDVSTGWGVAQAIENNLGEAKSAQVAMDSNGNAFVVWAQSGSPFSIYVNRFDVNTGFAGAVLLEQRERGDASVPQLVIDNRGNAIVSWQHSDGVQQNILAAVYNNTDSTWSAERVIETTNTGDAVSPVIAVSDSGNAVVAWQQNNNGELTIAANHFAVGNNGIPNINPIAVAGIDQNVDEQTTVMLDGSASFDQDSSGLISAYSWTQTAGIAVTLTGATTATPNFTALTLISSEVLTFELTVTDDANAISTSTVNITINPVNAMPTANAGVEKNVNEQTTVTLTGTGSDTDGTIDTYSWTQISGTAVTLNTASTATATFDAPIVTVQQGVQTLVFELTVTDNENATATSQVNVLVSPVNATPVANAGIDQSVDEQSVVNLTGTASDTDGVISTYAWIQVSGLPVTLTGDTTANASFTTPAVLVQDGAQTIVLRLTVTDNEGATFSDDISVVVNAVNALPIADAGLPQSVDEQTTVLLQATSFDSDGSVVSHQWTQTAGTSVTISNATTISASFVAPTVLVQDGAQTSSFTLTVTDNEGAVVTSTPVTITVNPVNANPTVNAGLDVAVDEQSAVNLTAAANDSDGSIASYSWTQISGVPVILTGNTTANASFAAPTVLVQDGPQTLIFSVVVTDNETASVTDEVVITVNPVNANPTANAGIDQNIDEQTAVTLTGSGADTDGSITSYLWTQTGGVAVTLTNANAVTATFTTPVVLVQDGVQTLTFRLTVTDNETATIFDDINVVVNPVNAYPTANAGANRAVNEQTAVTLTGTGSDTDGSITTYQWTQITGPTVTLTNANTAIPNFTTPVVLVADSPTVLTFRLTVTDNETAIATSDVNIGVMAVNALPVTNAGVDKIVNEQTAVSITATGSDSDGSITAYQWTQVSGIPVTLATANTATATFTTPVVLVQDGAQVLIFRNTVTDNEGAIHSDEMTVTVQPVNALPVANAGLDQRIAEYSTVTLSGTGIDSDGSITAYQWTQVSGLPVVITNSTTATASFTAPPVYQDEVLSFNLVVTDNETGVSVADSVNITLFSVNPDDDADGLPDLYEIANFGSLTRDGTADFDNDGYTDLQEFEQGTNPLALTLAAPTNIKAVAADAQVTLSWTNVDSAVGYKVYWDTVPNVTKDSNVINNLSSGYVHTGLTNGTTYYYVVTTLSSADESVVSDEVSAIPGKRTWQSAQAVDTATINYFYPQIAMNRTGQSVVVFEQYDGIAYSTFANIYNKDTGWGTAQSIETGDSGNVYNPQVAIDDNGNAVAVWEQFNGTSYNVWANVYDVQNASWGIAEQIESSLTGGGEYFMPQVAMSKSGSAIVTWQKRDGLAISIWASRFDMGTGWTQAEKLESNDLYSAYLPQLDVDSTGNAVVVWEQYNSVSSVYSTWSSHYNVATGWSTAAVISNVDNISAYDTQVALSDSGKTVAVWEQFDGTRFNVWTNVAQNGVWGTAERVEYNTTGASEYYYPQVAMDKLGNATVVWQQFDGSQLSAWANRYTNGVWETALQIEANGITPITNPKVAMDEDGNAVAVWEQYDDTSNNSLISIWANRYSEGNGWESAQPLETIDNETMWFPEVTMDAYGNAQAVWFHGGITEDDILVAENILKTNPPIANAGVDQGGFVAKDIVSLDATGSLDVDGTITSYHWHQLSGEEVSLTGKDTATPTFAAPRSQSTLVLSFTVTVTDNDGLTNSDTVVITIGDTAVTSLFSSLFSSTVETVKNNAVNLPEQFSTRQFNLLTKTNRIKGKTKFFARLRSHAIERMSIKSNNLNNQSIQISTTDGQGGRGRPVKSKKLKGIK